MTYKIKTDLISKMAIVQMAKIELNIPNREEPKPILGSYLLMQFTKTGSRSEQEEKMFESKEKINVLAILLAMIFVFITPLNVSAYSRDGNKLNPNYSLTGNGASDIVAVAKAQLGKKYTDFSGFHYRAWCADFVSACAAAANQSNAIPGNASVSGMRSSI